MRRPKYLSPSAINAWLRDKKEYYIKYMSDTPTPKEPQNKHMAVGNSFDAYVKAYLHEKIVKTPPLDFKTVFESQIEPHMRTKEVLAQGEYLFGKYKQLLALDSLMLVLGKGTNARFEMDVRGSVEGGKEGDVRGVPTRVKPDLFFQTESGATVLLDWKVNGFFGDKTPTPGYAILREDGKRAHCHGDARLELRHGIYCNVAHGIEHYNEEWARQLSIGAWLSGCAVGTQFVGIVHQLTCKPQLKDSTNPMPRVRVAEHVGFVSKDFQEATLSLMRTIWDTVNSDHFFRDMSKAESQDMCALLDKRVNADSGPQTTDAPLQSLPW